MKKSLVILLIAFSVNAYGAFKPIEYHVQKNYHRMMLLLKGDVQWTVNRAGEKMEVVVTGAEKNFVVKNMKYNFQSGVIKEFVIQPSGADRRKINIQLRRNVDDYKIYQESGTKNLYIEFYPGKEIAAAAVPSRPVEKPTKQTVERGTKQIPVPAKNTIVNIPQVVLDQVESEQPAKKNEEKLFVSAKRTPASESSQPKSNAAMWLLFATLSIFLGGGSFLAFTVIKRKQWLVKKSENKVQKDFAQHFEENLSTEPVRISVPEPPQVLVDENEDDFSQSIEFAEQYLRSQGEFELQMRLEKLTARSSQKKIAALPKNSRRKTDSTSLTAQKLGLSVGELELVSRLQKYHKRQSTESV